MKIEWSQVKSGPAGTTITPNMIMHFGNDELTKNFVEYLLFISGNKNVKNKEVIVNYKGWDVTANVMNDTIGIYEYKDRESLMNGFYQKRSRGEVSTAHYDDKICETEKERDAYVKVLQKKWPKCTKVETYKMYRQ